MRRIEIEYWAQQVIRSVENGHPREDSRVELKSQWPNSPEEAARQIAAHANAARSGPILWLIGVHERRGVEGASHQEMSNWFSQVQKHFDGVAPELVDLNIPVGEKTIVALYFETDRAPYVIRNPNAGKPGSGPITYEVPWREGTHTRSARRSDLINLLVPLERLPDIEGVEGVIQAHANPNQDTLHWHLFGVFYITPRDSERVVIRIRKSSLSFDSPGLIPVTPIEQFRIRPRNSQLNNMSTTSEALVYDPGEWVIEAHWDSPYPSGILGNEGRITARLSLAPSGDLVSSTLILPSENVERQQFVKWASGVFVKRTIQDEDDPYGA